VTSQVSRFLVSIGLTPGGAFAGSPLSNGLPGSARSHGPPGRIYSARRAAKHTGAKGQQLPAGRWLAYMPRPCFATVARPPRAPARARISRSSPGLMAGFPRDAHYSASRPLAVCVSRLPAGIGAKKAGAHLCRGYSPTAIQAVNIRPLALGLPGGVIPCDHV